VSHMAGTVPERGSSDNSPPAWQMELLAHLGGMSSWQGQQRQGSHSRALLAGCAWLHHYQLWLVMQKQAGSCTWCLMSEVQGCLIPCAPQVHGHCGGLCRYVSLQFHISFQPQHTATRPPIRPVTPGHAEAVGAGTERACLEFPPNHSRPLLVLLTLFCLLYTRPPCICAFIERESPVKPSDLASRTVDIEHLRAEDLEYNYDKVVHLRAAT
jgi:hypothetical protein